MNLRMKYTGKIALCGWGLSLLLTFAACSDEESNVTTQEGNATMTFRLSTRAEGDEATSTEQHTHLYVAERLSEHSGIVRELMKIIPWVAPKSPCIAIKTLR